MTSEELKRRYNVGERDFQGADLQGADLRRVDLSYVCLQGANLRKASLQDANLESANLRDVDLQGACLQGANLQDANLEGAYLKNAYLPSAYLQGTNLQNANLYGANLQNASLEGADLYRANLEGANLQGTCLAPDAVCAAPPTDEDIAKAGLELHGDRVYGWRTKKSQHCGSTIYEVGREYEAPWFSVDHTSSCHPGLYLAGKEWLEENYRGVEVVRVYCLRSELVHAGDKWRARRLWVVADDESVS
jgi:hypothetical protein